MLSTCLAPAPLALALVPLPMLARAPWSPPLVALLRVCHLPVFAPRRARNAPFGTPRPRCRLPGPLGPWAPLSAHLALRVAAPLPRLFLALLACDSARMASWARSHSIWQRYVAA